MNDNIPPMMCGSCGKNIDPCRGYFSTHLMNNRVDFHIACKPRLTFNKVVYEAPIEEQADNARKAGL